MNTQKIDCTFKRRNSFDFSLAPLVLGVWRLLCLLCVLQAVWPCVVGLVRLNRGGEDVAVALYTSMAALVATALAAQVCVCVCA